MEINEEKNMKRTFDNSSYKERFQFQLKVNDNIICQRYFKIPLFNKESLTSNELFETLGGYRGKQQESLEYFGDPDKYLGVVQMIKRDLESKSRVYLWNVLDNKVKLTGFAKNSDGSLVNEETHVSFEAKEFDETEFVQPGEVTFKFSFMVDEEPVYEEIWDGSQYPKYVRNSVDITNGYSKYPMVQLMNHGKKDLVVEIIKKICDVCSNVDAETNKNYTKFTRFGVDDMFAKASGMNANKTVKYSYTNSNRDYINGWRMYCLKKYGNVR